MEAGNYRLTISTRTLSTMAGIRDDLRIAEEMLEWCVEADSELHDQCEVLEEACWTTAVIRYFRCFKQRPWPKEEALAQLSPEELESHQFFFFLRDRFFAHEIGGVGEDFEVSAYVRAKYDGAFEIAAVGPAPRRICSLGTDLAGDLLTVVQKMRTIVDVMYESERSAVMQTASSLPLTEAIRGDPLAVDELSISKNHPAFRTQYLKNGSSRRRRGS
jgi:hypothetical protein